MHYVTRISYWMQKHKFDVTCPNALFMETTPVPLEREKQCVDVSRPGGTGMHYVIHRYHWMQKHKFGVSCPNAFLWNSYR
jgi:hypothetical protein